MNTFKVGCYMIAQDYTHQYFKSKVLYNQAKLYF